MKTHDPDWWRSAVIYQIYPRSFYDSNGDGIGDLPGVTARLDHVARLGVDAIWVSPFFPSPHADFGYDVASHCDVDPIFGTLDDFDRLLHTAHSLGLKVLIDQVWGHTSNEHPWFVASRAARSGDHADWYVWADPTPDGTAPNNWLSVFGGSAWTWEPRRRQYYLHHFLSSQPKLNLRNPQVREALLDSGRFWLDRGVDGFRLDAIDFYLHDEQLRSNPPALGTSTSGPPLKPFGMQRHLYDMMGDASGFLREIRALTDRYPGTATLGEVSSQAGAFARISAYTGCGSQLHMAYTLGLMKAELGARTFYDVFAERAASIAKGCTGTAPTARGVACWAFNNHDVQRAVSRWRGEDNAAFERLLMALLLSLEGSVCLYQGEELGLPEARLPLEALRDPFGIAYAPEFNGRDGSRTPMPWASGSPAAGFTTSRAPWLPVPAQHHARAVDLAEADPDSLLNAYRRFLAWRRTQPDLLSQALVPLEAPEPVLAFTRGRTLCLFNLGDRPFLVRADAEPLQGHGFEALSREGWVSLPPYGVAFGRLAQAVQQPGLQVRESSA